MLKFPKKKITEKQKQALEEQAKIEQRIKEADERISKGRATEEDIDIMVDEFLAVVDALEEGKLEFIQNPTQVYTITINR